MPFGPGRVPPVIALPVLFSWRLRGTLPVLRRRYVTMQGMGAHRSVVQRYPVVGSERLFIKKGPGCLTGPPMNLFQYRRRVEESVRLPIRR